MLEKKKKEKEKQRKTWQGYTTNLPTKKEKQEKLRKNKKRIKWNKF